MEATVDASKILVRPFPSLSHLATVGVALPLWKNFKLKTLRKAFSEAQSGSSTLSEEDSQLDWVIRARNAILPIPPLFRERVLEAVNGLQSERQFWSFGHLMLSRVMSGEECLHWSSVGRIDTVKTAQEVLRDRNIGIKKRFEIACKYGLDENIKSLWSEMKKSDKAKCEKSPDNSLVGFWVRWLREGSPKPWSQAAEEFFSIPQREFRIPFNRFSALFPSLPLNDRHVFLDSSLCHDCLLCVLAMTKEEQEEILEKRVVRVLTIYMEWPLLSLFVETAEKLFRFLDPQGFSILLHNLSRFESKQDFDYSELFWVLWNKAPNSWKERARKDRELKMAISSWLEEVNKKENTRDINESAKRKTGSDTARIRTRKSRKLQ